MKVYNVKGYTKPMTLLEIVDQINNKGACVYTENKAYNCMELLGQYIPKELAFEIRLAISHCCDCGEGAAELGYVCDKTRVYLKERLERG